MFAKNQTSKYGKLAVLRTFKIIAKIWPELKMGAKTKHPLKWTMSEITWTYCYIGAQNKRFLFS